MAANERLTISLPSDLAATVRDAVADGGYASTGDVVRDALRDWSARRAAQAQAFAALQADIEIGLADIAAGRVVDFDIDRIIARGRQGLKRRSA